MTLILPAKSSSASFRASGSFTQVRMICHVTSLLHMLLMLGSDELGAIKIMHELLRYAQIPA